MLRTILLLPALLLASTLPQPGASVCPPAQLIKPCTCDDEGLQCLQLNDTGLERVFQAPAQRKAIRRVWIFQTNLTCLKPSSFGHYIIRDLYLDLNQISLVHSGAFGDAASTLQSLSLTRNLLSSFPFHELSSMRRLKQLGLGHNQLKSINSNSFPQTDTLESIDLSHNNIAHIEPFAFAQLHEVSLIDLSRNNLTHIINNSLLVKSSTRHLAISLRANRIHKLDMGAFGQYHPHTLDLSKNQLDHLDELTFRPLLANQTIINVDENPFSCRGCKLYRWLLLLNRDHLANLDNFSCIDDTQLEDLTLELIGCTSDGKEPT